MQGRNASGSRLKLFENRWLEKLTVISVGWFVAIWAIFLPLIAYAAWGSASLPVAMLLLGAGWLVWSLLEYLAHRYLFHFEAKNPILRYLAFLLHGNHHAQPNDKLRNLMPPIVSIPVSLAIWALFHFVVGEGSDWAFLGFIGGYVAYDLTHYACHQWPASGALSQRVKRHHLLHHFASDESNYAVTALFWDRVFGTQRRSVGNRSASVSNAAEDLEPAD